MGDLNSGEGPEGNEKAPDARRPGSGGNREVAGGSGQGGMLGSELAYPPSCQQSFSNGSV